jgi:uncharacterized OsmC-like protein
MAISTVKVSSKVKSGYTTTIDCSHTFIIDQPKAAGGRDEGPNPLEVFLSSLGGCVCAIGKIISNQKKLRVKMIEVSVEGDIDKDFLMGNTEEGRAGFTEIRVFAKIDADMSLEEKKDFMAQITRRCPIADNILNVSVISPNVE